MRKGVGNQWGYLAKIRLMVVPVVVTLVGFAFVLILVLVVGSNFAETVQSRIKLPSPDPGYFFFQKNFKASPFLFHGYHQNQSNVLRLLTPTKFSKPPQKKNRSFAHVQQTKQQLIDQQKSSQQLDS